MDHQGGYATAATWISRDAEDERLVVRKFAKLAAANLLYLQAEIIELEKQFDDMQTRTARSGVKGVKEGAASWEAMVHQSQKREEGECHAIARGRMSLILQIRAKLKEYNEALVLQSQVSHLKPPDKHVLKSLKEFFNGPSPVLAGTSQDFLLQPGDLVAVKAPPDSDYLSSLLRRHWFFQKKSSAGGHSQHHEKRVALTANIITVLVAALFLIGPMTSMSFVRKRAIVLIWVAAFTFWFAVSIGFITNAKRAEIFTATAAYAAVLVVFVSSDNVWSEDV